MKRRLVNLNFFTLHFPVTAWVSVAHRLSGIFVFLMIPGLLWILQESLASKARFQNLGVFFSHPIAVVGLWLLLAALLYHWVAGLRHLLMDIHIGESKTGGRIGAWLVIYISFGFILLLGYKLW
ncbi:MAG TPA: succinate dehydrogenase, cytochrome b556 subunit [Gammaproteobacteria bacterium]|nr:succinate dehydrogenase, cytochrome b556 subunit [Gammaproteobacteria bacterium]